MFEQEEDIQRLIDAEVDPISVSKDFLISCMSENLNQARHVENERMMFVTILTALIGGVIAVLSQVTDTVIAVTLLLALISLDIICIILVKRWNKTFSEHLRVAREIYLQMLYPQFSELQIKCFNNIDAINKFYYFDNKLNTKYQKVYVRTNMLFDLYNYFTLALLISLLIYKL